MRFNTVSFCSLRVSHFARSLTSPESKQHPSLTIKHRQIPYKKQLLSIFYQKNIFGDQKRGWKQWRIVRLITRPAIGHDLRHTAVECPTSNGPPILCILLIRPHINIHEPIVFPLDSLRKFFRPHPIGLAGTSHTE